ncbi:hypothetical protein TRIP_C30018 [Candidatus Zixiibacteriota bacterium]|nr:hypothetical protein TRIP_C30018 [candidate division Zixibacteria bacterium]
MFWSKKKNEDKDAEFSINKKISDADKNKMETGKNRSRLTLEGLLEQGCDKDFVFYDE